MSDKLFTDEIYNEGLKLYDDGKVGRVKTFSNQYHCLVNDGIYYRVIIAINKSQSVIDMSCSCPEAKAGRKCKHEAATYINLVNQKLINGLKSISDFSLKTVYDRYLPYVNGYLSDEDINCFLIDVNNELKNILKATASQKPVYIFEHLKNIIIDYSHINLPRKYTEIIESYFIEELNCLFIFNKVYISLYLKWFEEALIHSQSLSIIELLFKINKLINKEMLVDIYVHLLGINEIISDDFIIEYIQNDIADIVIDKAEYFSSFSSYFENDMFSEFLLIFRFIALQENKYAYQSLVTFQEKYPSHSLTKKLTKIKEKLKEYRYDNNDYMQEVIKIYSLSHHQNNMQYVEKLKAAFGEEWNIKKYDFYDNIRMHMTEKKLIHFLENNQEGKWPSYYLLKSPSIHNLFLYQDLILKYDFDNYGFIVLECVMNEIGYKNSSYNLQKILSQLCHTRSFNVTDSTVEKIIKEIRYAYNENVEFMLVIDKFLEGTLYDDYSITY